MNNRQIGSEYEDLALRFLEKQGLKRIAGNYRCREGEIDLIMRDANHLVFVEVKFRRSAKFGDPFDAINRRKQTTIRKVAGVFLSEHREYAGLVKRFDCLGILGNQIEWMKDAF